MRACDKGALDDIPMDIFELLSNNLHEKRLKNAEYVTKRMDYLSQFTEDLKDGGVTDVVKRHRNEGLEFVYDKLIQQKFQVDTRRNGLWAAGMSDENAYDQQKAYRSSIICDQDRDINPNQQKVGDSSTRFHAFSDSNIFPVSREDVRVTGQYENSSPPKLSGDRYNLLGQVVSYRNFGKAHDALMVLSSGDTSGIYDINHKLNQLNMDTSKIYLQLDQTNFVHKTTSQRSLKPPAKNIFSRAIPTVPTSVLEIDNGCHSKATRPADQHTSGNISALNFRAVWSREYCKELPNTNCTGLIQESELLRSGVCVKSTETLEHQGNSCKLVRPIPRTCILGNILQKEIMNLSGNFRQQSVINVGHSNQIMSPNISAISRTGYSNGLSPM